MKIYFRNVLLIFTAIIYIVVCVACNSGGSEVDSNILPSGFTENPSTDGQVQTDISTASTENGLETSGVTASNNTSLNTDVSGPVVSATPGVTSGKIDDKTNSGGNTGNISAGVSANNSAKTSAKPSASTSASTSANTTKPSVSQSSGTSYSVVKSMSIPNDSPPPPVNLSLKVPSALKANYEALFNGLKNKVNGIVFKEDITSDVGRLIYYVSYYNPQLYYVDWSYVRTSTKTSGGKVIETKLYFDYKGNSSSTDISKVESKVNEIVAAASKKANSFEREVFIHDYLVKNISYTISTEHCGSIYGALIEGKAKCEGYSKAFQYIMNKLGIETYLITGTAGERHMWNMIKLYGEYYFVDVTHDDPLPDVKISDGQEYLITHANFNISESMIKTTHTIDAKNSVNKNGEVFNIDLQTCSSTTYNYYKVRGLAVANMSEYKYVLNANKNIGNVEVLYTGTMPTAEQFTTAFKEFIKDQYPKYNSLSFTNTKESSSQYKRKAFRISWTVK